MALRIYERPLTEVVLIHLSDGVLLQGDPTQGTSDVFANEHHWEEERLDDGLDDGPFTYTVPSLWDE